LTYSNLNPANFKTNSTLTSAYTQDGRAESFVGHVSPFAVGLKVRLGMDICSSKTAKKPVEQPKQTAVIPTPAPVPVPEPVPTSEPESRLAKARAMIAAREKEEVKEEPVEQTEEVNLKDAMTRKNLERMKEDYGTSVKGYVTIELQGYELDQTVLSPKMERILDAKIDEIRKTYGDNVSIVAEGHTCDLGSEAYNMKLGQKRAEVVRAYLIKRGYKPENVVATSKGPNVPIVPNTSEENRKKNRRVELIIRDLQTGTVQGRK